LGLSGEAGRLASGHRADVLILEDPDWRYLAYHLCGDKFATRIKSGQTL
jgi:imidazolonepropionase-like amidohydrolase